MHINVTDQQGVHRRLEALEGFRVMEIIRDWGLDIRAECGGACATCHVHVAPDWTGELPEKLDEEIDRLDHAFDVSHNSRLSRQLIMTKVLDGLTVTLALGTGNESGQRDAA